MPNEIHCIYPNPTTGNFIVDASAIGRVHELSVTDAIGRVVVKSTITSFGPMAIDLNAHESGLYLVQVEFADGTRAIERVVKE